MLRRGNRIREVRTAAGVSTTELGAAIGMTQSHVSRIENAKVELNISVLYKIAEALKVDPRELLDAGDTQAVQLAPVKGHAFYGEVFHPPYELIPIPNRMTADAFQYREGSFWFAHQAFPSKKDNLRPWIIRLASTENGTERIRLCTVENGGTPEAGFFSRMAPPADRWVYLGDPRILQSWRIVAGFELLKDDLPLIAGWEAR